MAEIAGYTKVPIVLLQAGDALSINVYIHLPMNDKLVHFAKKGEELSLEQMLKLKTMAPSQILTPTEDYKEAMKQIADSSDDGIPTPESSAEPWMDKDLRKQPSMPGKMKQAASGMMQSLAATNTAQKGILEESQLMISTIMSHLKAKGSKSANAFEEFLTQLSSETDPIMLHNKSVSALAVLILMALGKGTMDDISDLAFAGLAHDLCLPQVPSVILNSHLGAEGLLDPKKLFTLETQARQYDNHMDLAIKLLVEKGKYKISEATHRMILQHHETWEGTGPKGLSGAKIYYPSRVLRIADDWVCLLQNPQMPQTFSNAFRQLEQINRMLPKKVYDPDLLAQIGKVLFAV